MTTKIHNNNFSRMGILAMGLIFPLNLLAAPTRVGNGDEGSDLEGSTVVESGPIFDSRIKAVNLLKSLNVKSIFGLGYLIPEVEKTDLRLSAKNVAPLLHETGKEVSADHKTVFARTFAEPYASTRFFPAALKLTEDQLIALHIHEGLHRALPEAYRQNEDVVAEITLAIVTPGANADRIQKVVSQSLNSPSDYQRSTAQTSTTKMEQVKNTTPPKKDEVFYSYHVEPGKEAVSQNRSYHGTGFKKAFLQGTSYQPMIGFTAIVSGKSQSQGSQQVIDLSGFQIQSDLVLKNYEETQFLGFISNSFATGNSDSIERDVLTVGLKANSKSGDILTNYYVDFSPQSHNRTKYSVNERLYKNIWSMGAKAGYSGSAFDFLALTDLHLSDGVNYSPETWAFNKSLGRFSLLTLGVEFGFKFRSGRISIFEKGLISKSDSSASVSALGDPIDRGLGNSTYGVKLNWEM